MNTMTNIDGPGDGGSPEPAKEPTAPDSAFHRWYQETYHRTLDEQLDTLADPTALELLSEPGARQLLHELLQMRSSYIAMPGAKIRAAIEARREAIHTAAQEAGLSVDASMLVWITYEGLVHSWTNDASRRGNAGHN